MCGCWAHPRTQCVAKLRIPFATFSSNTTRCSKQIRRKCRVIREAATDAFLSKGYDGTSMNDIATLAAVSKPTVYKYFADKERLFAAIVLASTDQVVDLVRFISDALADTRDVEQNLNWLARRSSGCSWSRACSDCGA